MHFYDPFLEFSYAKKYGLVSSHHLLAYSGLQHLHTTKLRFANFVFLKIGQCECLKNVDAEIALHVVPKFCQPFLRSERLLHVQLHALLLTSERRVWKVLPQNSGSTRVCQFCGVSQHGFANLNVWFYQLG